MKFQKMRTRYLSNCLRLRYLKDVGMYFVRVRRYHLHIPELWHLLLSELEQHQAPVRVQLLVRHEVKFLLQLLQSEILGSGYPGVTHASALRLQEKDSRK